MSEQRLLEKGAVCVAGDLILRNTTVGHYRNGGFNLTPEGRLMAEEVDVEAVEVVEIVARPAAKKATKVKAAAELVTDVPVEPAAEDHTPEA